MLRKFSLARTPHEETFHLFENSERVRINENPFSIGVLRALSAALSLDQWTEDINIHFVKGGDTAIDVLFKEKKKVLLVHEKWIDFHRIHEGASCEVSRFAQELPAEMEAFFCDHVVEDLCQLVLDHIRSPLNLHHQESLKLRRVVRERVQQIPRLINFFRTDRANELGVTWTGNESGCISKKYSANMQYHVILHSMSTCWSKEGELLHQAGTYISSAGALQMKFQGLLIMSVTEPTVTPPESGSHATGATNARCGCAHQVVPHRDAKAFFSELNHEEAYFPMIARLGSGTFFGIPPAPIAPPKPTVNQGTDSASQPLTEQQDIFADELSRGLLANHIENGANAEDEDDDTTVNMHVEPDPLPRRATARTSHKGRREPQDTDAAESLAWSQDETNWQR